MLDVKTIKPRVMNSLFDGMGPLTDASGLAKWLIPSAAALFAVVGFVVESAHSGFLGGGLSSSAGAGYTAAASDFVYDFPTIAADLLVSCLSLHCGREGTTPLGGHGMPLLVAALLASLAWWLPRILRNRMPMGATAAAPLLLLILLVGKFIWFDAPMARIENVVVADEKGDDAWLGWKPPKTGGMVVDGWIETRRGWLWRHIVCSRDPRPPSGRPVPEICPTEHPRDARLMEGEFAARVLAWSLIAALSLRVAHEEARWWRLALVLWGLASFLTLPYAYGKLLKPTIFEFGKIDLSVAQSEIVAHGKDKSPLTAIVLARRATSVDLLVEGDGTCANGKKYSVTRVWSITNSQILSIREIARYDVLRWKLNHEPAVACDGAAPPGGSSKLNG